MTYSNNWNPYYTQLGKEPLKQPKIVVIFRAYAKRESMSKSLRLK